MNSVNIFEKSHKVQDKADFLLRTFPQAVLRKKYQDKSGLKKAAADRYKTDMRREKKINNNKKWNKNEKERKKINDEPSFHQVLKDSRSIEEFQYLNKIDEGAFGIVYRARDNVTDDIVALKLLKPLNEREGFSIAAQRELTTLLKIQHPNIVAGKEIAVGSASDEIYLVMQYEPHQLKKFIEAMRQNNLMFSPEHVKCLMTQLLTAVKHLHDHCILHRDLKTNNILLSQDGTLKVADFGMAREYEFPLRPYTPGVVTRWYRAPELLLLSKEYSTPIDMWSIGCIFAELFILWPLFPGSSELDQLDRIFKVLGTPSDIIWPGYSDLPPVRYIIFDDYPPGGLRERMSGHNISDNGLCLLEELLKYDPAKRVTAAAALDHSYFKEQPVAIEPSRFPISMESVESEQFSGTETGADSATLSALENDVIEIED